MDARLALVLNGDLGPDAEVRLRGVFASDPVLEMFLDAVLDDAPWFRPPRVVDQQVRAAGYGPLAGDLVPPAADLFCCPRGDVEWFSPGVGTPVPECASHHLRLRPC